MRCHALAVCAQLLAEDYVKLTKGALLHRLARALGDECARVRALAEVRAIIDRGCAEGSRANGQW